MECIKCGENRKIKSFGLCDKCYQKDYRKKNREKLKKRYAERYRKNKDKYKSYFIAYYRKNKEALLKKGKVSRIKRVYNVSMDFYNKLLTKQDFRCAICDCDLRRKKIKKCIDHDHNNGRVRGILCNNCNIGLGIFKEDKKILIKARDYLENW